MRRRFVKVLRQLRWLEHWRWCVADCCSLLNLRKCTCSTLSSIQNVKSSLRATFRVRLWRHVHQIREGVAKLNLCVCPIRLSKSCLCAWTGRLEQSVGDISGLCGVASECMKSLGSAVDLHQWVKIPDFCANVDVGLRESREIPIQARSCPPKYWQPLRVVPVGV